MAPLAVVASVAASGVLVVGAPVLVALLAGLLGGGAVVSKWMDRHITRAQAERTDIDNLRLIIDEHRADRTAVRTEVEELRGRIAVLEERERHMLTRAAVHEAWDQFAFAALVATNPQHPPPPPLTQPERSTTP